MIALLAIGKRGKDICCLNNSQNATGGYDYLKEKRYPAIVNAMQSMTLVIQYRNKYRATPPRILSVKREGEGTR